MRNASALLPALSLALSVVACSGDDSSDTSTTGATLTASTTNDTTGASSTGGGGSATDSAGSTGAGATTDATSGAGSSGGASTTTAGTTGGDADITEFCTVACNDCFNMNAPWKSMPADQCISECVADFEDCAASDIPTILQCTGGAGCPVGALEFGTCVAPFTCLL